MTEEAEPHDPRAIILTQFALRWEPKDAERRVKLLEEALPGIENYLTVSNAQRVENKLHPEHLEMYAAHLRPRVRSVLEHCAPKVIDSIQASLSPDERLAKIIKIINMLEAKAKASKAEESPGTGVYREDPNS
jgi:glutamine synthetase adenylyltransferase